ncbi:MAG TPA: hypothetical protein VG055_25550 [Planctomycetaceae bacterium]|jgi:hypothetical protein|nr:hypothetical protein [Planctomycetaceae bacterium]
MNGGSGTLWITTANPDPTGTGAGLWTAGSATVQAVCWKAASVQQEGVFIGNGRVFYIDWTSTQYVQQACDAHGNASGPATQITGTPKSGDTLALCIAALKDGKFTISYSINGKVAASETEVSLPGLTTGPTFNSGFWGVQAAQFGIASLVCGTGCGTACDLCVGQQSECWVLDPEGISLPAYNGHFCLKASGCTLSDPNHTNSWTVSIGQAQSTLFAGTSPNYAKYTLNGKFNCNGSNTFSFSVSGSTQGTGWPTTITLTPADCSGPPCVVLSTCGGCSWPTRWTCTISGISTVAECPMDPPFFPPGIPYSVPPDPPWRGDCNGAPQGTCENVMNGTITLTGGTGPAGWMGGAANWNGSNGFPQNNLCSGSLTGGQFGLYCMASAGFNFPLPNFTYPMAYSIPTTGLLLLIRTAGGPMAWWNGGTWTCGGPAYYVPYFCAFSKIECMQPVTLYQLPYTPGQFPIGSGTAASGTAPAGVSQAPICSGFPGSITITPA